MVWQPEKLCDNCIKLNTCKKGKAKKEACKDYKPYPLPPVPNHGSNVRKEIYNTKEIKEQSSKKEGTNPMKCERCRKEMRNTIGGCYTCDSCGFGINDCVLRPTATPSYIPNRPTIDDNIDIPGLNLQGMQGWICPKCGASLSPYTSVCPFCAPNRNNRISYGTTAAESPNDKDYLKGENK